MTCLWRGGEAIVRPKIENGMQMPIRVELLGIPYENLPFC
jgi:hypothetical protein